MEINKKIFHVDWVLLALIMLVCGFGLFVVYSATDANVNVVIKHAIRIFAGLVAMLIVSQVPMIALKRNAVNIYLFALILLIVVLVFGVVGKGAQRWLDLGFMRLQPSEVMKLAMPLMVSFWVTKYPLPIRFSVLMTTSAIIFVPTLLIMLQPDLGTSILIAASGLIVVFLAGMSWKLIFAAVVGFCVSAPLLFYFWLHDYQRRRILTLFDPWQDPLGDGYHTIQSMIAIGSGGLSGKGYLQGTQSQLDFLPERHTDFIFSVLSEEFGFLGFALLLLAYLAIIVRGLFIAFTSRSMFAKLLAGSITLTFFLYVFVNIGMVTGILPVVGVPLPLISYGGTSMVTLMIGFGLLMAVYSHREIVAH
jgi:rod shape determining protein RodA